MSKKSSIKFTWYSSLQWISTTFFIFSIVSNFTVAKFKKFSKFWKLKILILGNKIYMILLWINGYSALIYLRGDPSLKMDYYPYNWIISWGLIYILINWNLILFIWKGAEVSLVGCKYIFLFLLRQVLLKIYFYVFVFFKFNFLFFILLLFRSLRLAISSYHRFYFF